MKRMLVVLVLWPATTFAGNVIPSSIIFDFPEDSHQRYYQGSFDPAEDLLGVNFCLRQPGWDTFSVSGITVNPNVFQFAFWHHNFTHEEIAFDLWPGHTVRIQGSNASFVGSAYGGGFGQAVVSSDSLHYMPVVDVEPRDGSVSFQWEFVVPQAGPFTVNFSHAATPEPGTFLLLSVGAAVLASRRKLRGS